MKELIKKIFFPFTLLTALLLISVAYTFIAIYIALAGPAEAAIYAAIAIPISLVLTILYLAERMLLRRFSYVKVLLAEAMLICFLYFVHSYQNRSIQIRFQTRQDAVLVLFDTNENSIQTPARKGIFSKELIVDTNILHLKPSMAKQERLSMIWPESWPRYAVENGFLLKNGDSIQYYFSTSKILDKAYYRNPEAYIDSIFRLQATLQSLQ